MNIAVIGTGRWGSFIAWYLSKFNHNVTLFGRENSANLKKIKMQENNFAISCDFSKITNSEIIVISIASQSLRALMHDIEKLNLKNKTFVLCMKGIEIDTDMRLSEVTNEFIDKTCKVAVWLGPGHVEEFKSDIPNCMVIDSDCEETKKDLILAFSSPLIRFYYGSDLIGNEIGAAAKNVIGIAAGMLDGFNLSTLKGALMSRGTREVARLIKSMGGNENSAYGLCHLGDYEATVFSKYSHNRQYGEKIVKGESFDSLAEGYYTVKALYQMGKKNNVDLPICNAVYSILYEKADVKEALLGLLSRTLKEEFYD